MALIPVQRSTAADDIARHLKQTNAKLLITDCDVWDLAEAAATLVGSIPMVTLDKGTSPRCPSLDGLLDTKALCVDDIFQLNSNHKANEYNGFINRTSGSTGNMKCVLISHAHFIATMEGTRATIPKGMDPDRDVWLSPISLGFFINAKLNMGLNILLGIPVVLMSSELHASATVDVIQRRRVTFLFITPPLAAELARLDMGQYDLSHIKWLLTAGAPIHENLRQTLSSRFGGVPLSLELGTAETMLISIQFDDRSRKPGSTGTLVSGMEAKVVDPHTGAERGVDEAGEILVRNRLARYKGYSDDDVANRAFDSDGWFHTGDYGYFDEDCNLYIVDRIKELIKTGGGYGVHVSATELESVLFTHEAVASVVVLGIRDEGSQYDRPAAFVVPKPNHGRDINQLTDEIAKFAKQRLTGLRSLTGGVYCIPELPKTGFKVNKRALREIVNMAPAKVHRFGKEQLN